MIKITETHGKDSYDLSTYEISVERILDDNILNTSPNNIINLLGFYVQQLSDCPEDATLERDLSYAYSAIDFFRLGLEIGRSGSNEMIVFDEFRKEFE